MSVCDRSVVSPVTLVSSTNKTDHHNTIEILLKVVLNTINQTKLTYYQLENWTMAHLAHEIVGGGSPPITLHWNKALSPTLIVWDNDGYISSLGLALPKTFKQQTVKLALKTIHTWKKTYGWVLISSQI